MNECQLIAHLPFLFIEMIHFFHHKFRQCFQKPRYPDLLFVFRDVFYLFDRENVREGKGERQIYSIP